MAPTISRLSALHLKQRANAPKAISGRTAGNWPLRTDDNAERGGRLPTQNEGGRSTCFCARRWRSRVSRKTPSRTHRREQAPRLNLPPIAPTPTSKSPVGIASRLAFETCRRYRNNSRMGNGPDRTEGCVHTRIFVLRSNRPTPLRRRPQLRPPLLSADRGARDRRASVRFVSPSGAAVEQRAASMQNSTALRSDFA